MEPGTSKPSITGSTSIFPPQAALITLLVTLLLIKLCTIGNRDKTLPPGPKTIPLFGNALVFPTSFPHVKFLEWAQQYGPIFSLKIFGRTIVVVSSADAVKHILVTNSASSGDRPHSAIFHRATNGTYMAMANMDSPVWKQGRKAMNAFLTKDWMEKHLETQQAECTHLVRDILEEPKDIFRQIRRTTGSIMLSLVYGVRATKFENSLAEAAFKGVELLNKATDPGAHPPVDLIWPLQLVPSRWAYWKRLGDKARRIRADLYGSLQTRCEQAVKSKRLVGCYMESLILNQEKHGLSRDDIISLGSMMMDAGIETTASVLHSFILALINNPDVQEKGQTEIDKVVSANRWPELRDAEHVPYIRAIVDEVLRFRPPIPLALPHLCTKEIYYQGYRIPADSTIFMNTYGIYHDAQFYDDPETFNPDRFLKTEMGSKQGADNTGFRSSLAFGAGRRICPGDSIARRVITLNTMVLLWAFNFSKDNSGTAGQGIDAYSKPGLELAPKPFTCNATPRSGMKAQMIKDRFASTFPDHPC